MRESRYESSGASRQRNASAVGLDCRVPYLDLDVCRLAVDRKAIKGFESKRVGRHQRNVEQLVFGLDIALNHRNCRKESLLSLRRFIKGLAVFFLVGLTVSSTAMAESRNLAAASRQPTQSDSGSPQTTDKAAKAKDDKQPGDKAAKQEPTAQSGLTADQRLTYIIGVEDELQISVWREPELSTVVVVRPDGMITVPLVNDLKAAGLKTDELQNLLMEKFKGFVNEPQVTVIVRAIRSRKVYLVGQVGHQGTFPLNGDMTALELLAAAGGLGPFAKADSIYILREQNGKKIRIPFHYKKAVAGKSENVALKPGDVVVVP